MAKLGELYKITSGGTPSRSHSEYYEDGTIPWVKTGDLKDKYLFETDEKISQLGLENSSARIYLKNTVLLAMYGATIGATSILKIDAATNQACAAFSPREDVLPEYLYAFLESQKDKFIKDAVGGAQPNLSAGYLKTIEFKLPSLEQQTRITRNLSKIDELLLLRKQQIAKLDGLIKARFVEMFGDPSNNPMGWKKQNFEDIALLITDGEHMTPQRTNKGIYLLSARNILNHTIQLDDVDYIDEEEYGRIARRIVPQQGDVLVSCSGSIGRCCVVPSELKFQMVRSVALIRFNNTINPIFAEWLIATDELQKQIYTSATQSSQANLFQGKIRKLCGYVPPLSLQNQFAAFVERVDKQKQTVQQSLEKLELMKKALMQEYFG